MPPHRRVISTRGSFIFFSLLLCSQMLLSILMGKSFLNDENASFNLRSRNLYLLLSITKIFISFLKASFNLRSRNLYLLLSIPTILKSFFHFGNLYKLLSSFFQFAIHLADWFQTWMFIELEGLVYFTKVCQQFNWKLLKIK